MVRFRDPAILLRILLPAVLTSLLLIAPRPSAFTRELQRGKAAVNAGDHSSAAVHFASAAQQFPERVGLWEIAGKEAFAAGNMEAAVSYFQSAQDQGILSTPGKISLGDAYLETGNIEAAVEVLQSTLPNEESWQKLAQVFRTQRKYEQAADCLKALLQNQPGDASIAYQIGLLLAATNPPASFSYLAQAAGIDTKLAPPAGQIQSTIRTAQLSEEPAYIFLAAGRSLADLGEWDLAEEAFTRAVEIRPDYPEAWAYLGEARQHTTGGSTAGTEPLADLQRAYELDPASLSANLFLAFYYQRQNNHEEALEYLYKASRVDPENPIIQTEIGSSLAASGDLQNALLAYQKAVELDPKNPVFYRILAGFALSHQIQVRELALPAARQAVILDPRDPAALDLLGQSFYLLGDYSSADRFIHQALELKPDFPPAHLHLGMNYLLQGKMDDAYQSLLKTLRLAPGSSSADKAQRLLERYFP